MYSPRPVPRLFSFPGVFVTNLSNRFGRMSSAIPFPLSQTLISTLFLSPETTLSTLMVPLSVNLTALPTIFDIA